jgi:CheY-like chemotaxis protein
LSSSKNTSPGDAAAGRPQAPPIRRVAHRTVLLVEADPKVGAFTAGLFRQIGFKVISAGTSADALAKAQKLKREIHLLVADAEIPGVSGVEFAKCFRACRPKAKVVLVSGVHRGLSVRNGGWSFVPGSAILQVLRLKLDQILDPVDPPHRGLPRGD